MTSRSSVLEGIWIASPCQASWEGMKGDERVRFCADCKQNVYNLSDMDHAEAVSLVERHEGRLCVRFYHRADGTMLTRDCRAGSPAVQRLTALAAVPVGCLLLLWVAAVFGRGSNSHDDYLASLRQIKPLEPIIDWLFPPPPGLILGKLVMGTPSLNPPPPGVTVSGGS